MTRTSYAVIGWWMWATAVSLVQPVACRAVDQADQLVATDWNDVDEDFQFQGEYFGAVRRSVFDADNLGLQVVALGDGQFAGRLLRGGLPGGGWDRAVFSELSGTRADAGHLALTGGGYTIAVDGKTATIRAVDGPELVQLRKMQRVSLRDNARPPAGAIVLFDGQDATHLESARTTDDGTLEVGFLTAFPVQDFRLHLEFRLPYMPFARGQARGNSGVYVQQRYEVQVLDSFGLEGVENECGGLYKQKRPDVNMCFPPLSWQSYDIHFTAARWDRWGNKVADARVTVDHNGVVVQDNYALIDKTGAGKPEGPEPMKILFQNHRDPVRFRNIWIVPLGSSARLAADHAGGEMLLGPTVTCPPRLIPRCPTRCYTAGR